MPDYKIVRNTLVTLRDKYKADYEELAKTSIDHDDAPLAEIYVSILNEVALTIMKIQDQINYITECKIQE